LVGENENKSASRSRGVLVFVLPDQPMWPPQAAGQIDGERQTLTTIS
jgi:hypothetical protein